MIAAARTLPFHRIALFLSLLTLFAFTHCKTPSAMQDSESVSFTTVFLSSNATKEGYYMEGYVVEISEEEAKGLEGKKVRVTGKVTLVAGIGSGIDSNGEAVQGRQGDTRFISNPTIEIIE